MNNNNTSSLVPFEYEGRQIRVISDELGDPWFVVADLLASLGLDRKALERLDDDEKGVSSIHTGRVPLSGVKPEARMP